MTESLPSSNEFASLATTAAAIRQRQVSPVELTTQLLARIAALNPTFHAYTSVLDEYALAQARQAEAEILAGNYKGPLHGIPIGIKDLAQVAGHPNTCGSIVKKGWIPEQDATLVQRLKEAGAIIIGKLNMTEFALSGYHPDLPVPVNPWGADRWSGVSSSGSAVATALGMAFATLGTDTGGSIRFPAAVNGVVGIKPTFGRVSSAGVFPLAPSLDHPGPIARRVKDAALMLQVMAGFDAADPFSRRTPVADYTADIDAGVAGLRIGIDERYCADDTHPAVTEAVLAAAEQFAQLGASLVPVDVLGVRAVCPYWSAVVAAEAAVAHADSFPSQADRYGPVFRSALEAAPGITGTLYAQAQFAAAQTRSIFDAAFEQADVLLCPGAPLPAMSLAEFPPTAVLPPEAVAAFVGFAAPMNFSGHPTISVPCGQTEDGLPLGLQLVGRHDQEAMLVRAAHTFEQSTHWHTLVPPLECD